MQMIELEISKGNFTDGFGVRLDIRGGRDRANPKGRLPPNPNLKGLYQLWCYQYEALVTHRLGNAQNVAHGGDRSGCQYSFKIWQDSVNQWLQSTSMHDVVFALNRAFAAQPNNTQFNIKLPLLQSPADDCFILWQLPWHTWEILRDYPDIEPILTPITASTISLSKRRQNKGRILAITGGNKSTQKTENKESKESIDLNNSIDELKRLKTVELVYLNHPSPEEFAVALNDAQGWDILFFTGHSGMDSEGGWFELNPTTKIRAEQFQQTLQRASQKGLQLAILSSCDGVKLAQDLSSFNVPTVIAMREIIPNTVAQRFIKAFVQAFAYSEHPSNLGSAIRAARANLEGCTDYPGVTNLPMIFQRSPQPLSTWQELCPDPSDALTMLWRSLPILLAISLLVSGLIIFGQSLGWLQASELAAYNRLMQSRPIEEPDPRLLIVGADEGDLQKYGDPIPDGVFAEVLAVLNQYDPKAIGLDNYRNIPTSGRAELLQELNRNDKIITVCFFSIQNVDDSIPPPEIKREGATSGFVDVYNDDDIHSSDPTLRRYLLSKTSNPIEEASKCETDYSFAILLIDKYLQADGQEVRWDKQHKKWEFNQILIPRLNEKGGGYANLDSRGYQVLINYRKTRNPRVISQTINFHSLLNHSLKDDWIKNRIAIVGVTAASKHDEHHTPYGNISGPVIHAHVISQFLSAMEDNRPIISWFPEWVEFIWLFFWSSIAGIGIFFAKKILPKSIVLFIVTIFIWTISQMLFLIWGLWLPPISIILAAFTSAFISSLIFRGTNWSHHIYH